MQTFNQHLYNLCREVKITQEEALDCVDNNRELKQKLRKLPKITKESVEEIDEALQSKDFGL